MTCIVAIVDDSIYMGGERALYTGNFVTASGESKIFRTPQFLIGYAGDPGIGQYIGYEFDFPYIDSHEEMHTLMVPALRDHLDNISRVEDSSTSLLISYRDIVYEYSTDNHYLLPHREIAIGSGSEFALGSLHSTRGMEAETRVRMALEAAIEYNPGCLGPLDIEIM